MLSWLQMSVDECIDAYINLSKEVFDKRKLFAGLRRLGDGHLPPPPTMGQRQRQCTAGVVVAITVAAAAGSHMQAHMQ